MQIKQLRLLDANLNRLREGLRVVEDICRYALDDYSLSIKIKNIRHLSRYPFYDELLSSRDIINDCLKDSTNSEMQRADIASIILANFKRAQESSRVIEEISKLDFQQESTKFKHIRYELYDLEKEVMKTISNSK